MLLSSSLSTLPPFYAVILLAEGRAPRIPWDRNLNEPDDRIWRHDRFFELESGARSRRRPAFREIKAPLNDASDAVEISAQFRRGRGGENRNWREDRRHVPSGEPRRPRRMEGNREAEKWKHDLFDEGNRSSPPKNEEEEIAKLEALLAS